MLIFMRNVIFRDLNLSLHVFLSIVTLASITHNAIQLPSIRGDCHFALASSPPKESDAALL